uniref:Uncharacterized protein n=1 Tax=Lepisosteus oculatus TaxID=7918 RepID=W5MCL8_LEPOC
LVRISLCTLVLLGLLLLFSKYGPKNTTKEKHHQLSFQQFYLFSSCPLLPLQYSSTNFSTHCHTCC